MKRLLIIILVICLLSVTGCANQEISFKNSVDKSPLEQPTEFVNVIDVPDAETFSQKAPVSYDTYYVNNKEVEAFTFESHYSNGGQNPEYTLLFSIANNKKTELAKFTHEDAIIAFAETNSAGIFWTTSNYKVYSYLFADKKVNALPITSMATFSLNDDFLLFVDDNTEKLSCYDLKNRSVNAIYNISSMNIYWMPSIYNDSVAITLQDTTGAKVNCYDLKNKDISFSYEIKDNRIKNVVKTFHNDDWLLFMCLEDENNYSGLFLYQVNRKTNAVTLLDKKVDFCEILSQNMLVCISDGVIYTHDMTTGESNSIKDLENKTFYKASKISNGNIVLKTLDDLEVVVLNSNAHIDPPSQ